MNDLVDGMNNALASAVQRAGSRVHFVNYDQYVEMTNGQYCEPGVDESKGRGANRPDLFFYEMRSEEDEPTRPDNIENVKRDEGEVTPANGTVGAIYSAWMEATLEASDMEIELNADNANEELIEWVEEEKSNVANSEPMAKIQLTSGTSANLTAVATSGVPKMRTKEEDEKKSSVSPNSMARVFHPTRGGHEMIANLILYNMEAVRAGEYVSSWRCVGIQHQIVADRLDDR